MWCRLPGVAWQLLCDGRHVSDQVSASYSMCALLAFLSAWSVSGLYSVDHRVRRSPVYVEAPYPAMAGREAETPLRTLPIGRCFVHDCRMVVTGGSWAPGGTVGAAGGAQVKPSCRVRPLLSVFALFLLRVYGIVVPVFVSRSAEKPGEVLDPLLSIAGTSPKWRQVCFPLLRVGLVPGTFRLRVLQLPQQSGMPSRL